MNGFERTNKFFSLCGLNCALCPMNISGHCSGCGFGNQSCKIAKCSLENGKIEYCFECKKYPCQKYEHIDDFDSFITHKNQKCDLEKARQIGIATYNAEQEEKLKILLKLLTLYNDGRRKSLYCLAVNLLDIQDLRDIVTNIENSLEFDRLYDKAKAAYVVNLIQQYAADKGIVLKLRKKKEKRDVSTN